MEELSRRAVEYFSDEKRREIYSKLKNYNLCFSDFWFTHDALEEFCVLMGVILVGIVVLIYTFFNEKTMSSYVFINFDVMTVCMCFVRLKIFWRKFKPKWDSGIPLIVVFWIVEKVKVSKKQLFFGNEFYNENKEEILKIITRCYHKIKSLNVIKEKKYFFDEIIDTNPDDNKHYSHHLIFGEIRKNKFPLLIAEIERIYFVLDTLKEEGFGLRELTYLLFNSVFLEHSLKIYRNERD